MILRRFFTSRPTLAASLGYLLLAVILTWPLAARLGSRIPRGDHDLWQNYWNVWWWQRSFQLGESPLHTDLLFYPTGASLCWHTHSPGNVIAMLPVAWAAEKMGLDGPAAAIDLATFLGFFLASLGAFLLAREIIGRTGPALLAGVVFAYFPQHVEQTLEHLNLASYWAMPYGILFLARAARGDGVRAWLPAGLFLGLNALLAWHNGALLLFMAIAVVAAVLWRSPRKRKGLLGIALTGAVCLTMVLPLLLPMLQDLAGGVGGFKKPVYKPIDPLFLLIPHSGHPLWGSAVAGYYESYRPYPSVGFLGYLGIGAVCLWVAAGILRASPGREKAGEEEQKAPGALAGKRAFLFWSILAVFFILLSMGRYPIIAKIQYREIPLLYSFLEGTPGIGSVLRTVRVANRFLVPAMLAISLLAAMGGAAVSGLLRGPRLSRAVMAGILVILILDYLWVPYPLRELPAPPYLKALEELPEGLAILDIPTGSGPRAAEDMFNQTRHGRPIASGYIAKQPPEILKTIKKYPILEQVFLSHPQPPPEGASIIDAVQALKVGIVVVHLDRQKERILAGKEEAERKNPTDLYGHRLFNVEKGILKADLERMRAALRESCGPPVYQDSDTEVYLVKSIKS